MVVGAGSYAVGPPAHEGDVPRDMVTRELYITSEVAAEGRPLPSNQWWTDLLVARHGGKLWSYPLVVEPQQEGLDVMLPIEWNGNGSVMETDVQLTVRGAPFQTGSDVIIADFEGTDFGGWTSTGTAFGEGPVSGGLPGQAHTSGWGGRGFVNGFHGGDGPLGTLTSPVFTLSTAWLHLMVSGGNHPPEDPNGRACVEIWPAGSVGVGAPLWWATGENSETFGWRSWEVPVALLGSQVQIRAIDENSGGWGHVNFDHVVLSDESDSSLVGGSGFNSLATRVSGWGDWHVSARLEDGLGARMDFTLARGVPFVWVEFEGKLRAVTRTSGRKMKQIAETGLEGKRIVERLAELGQSKEVATQKAHEFLQENNFFIKPHEIVFRAFSRQGSVRQAGRRPAP